MGPEGTSSQNPPGDSDEPILVRIESAHRQIVNSVPKELAAAEEPHRIRETRLVADTYYLEEGGSGREHSTPCRSAAGALCTANGTVSPHEIRERPTAVRGVPRPTLTNQPQISRDPRSEVIRSCLLNRRQRAVMLMPPVAG